MYDQARELSSHFPAKSVLSVSRDPAVRIETHARLRKQC
jgi:hypothetical protein